VTIPYMYRSPPTQSMGPLCVSLQRPAQKGTGEVAKASGPAWLGSASMAHANRPGQTVAHRKTIFTSPSRVQTPPTPSTPRFPRVLGSHPSIPKPRVQTVESGGEALSYRVQLTRKNKHPSQTPNNIHVFVVHSPQPTAHNLPLRIRDAGGGVKHGTRLAWCPV
jgi:hypothetical protein